MYCLIYNHWTLCNHSIKYYLHLKQRRSWYTFRSVCSARGEERSSYDADSEELTSLNSQLSRVRATQMEIIIIICISNKKKRGSTRWRRTAQNEWYSLFLHLKPELSQFLLKRMFCGFIYWHHRTQLFLCCSIYMCVVHDWPEYSVWLGGGCELCSYFLCICRGKTLSQLMIWTSFPCESCVVKVVCAINVWMFCFWNKAAVLKLFGCLVSYSVTAEAFCRKSLVHLHLSPVLTFRWIPRTSLSVKRIMLAMKKYIY